MFYGFPIQSYAVLLVRLSSLFLVTHSQFVRVNFLVSLSFSILTCTFVFYFSLYMIVNPLHCRRFGPFPFSFTCFLYYYASFSSCSSYEPAHSVATDLFYVQLDHFSKHVYSLLILHELLYVYCSMSIRGCPLRTSLLIFTY